MYNVVSDIPLPVRKTYNKRASKYPFGQMQVGDSFYAEKKPSALLSAAYSFRKSNDLGHWSFKVRPEGDGTRIWRSK